jgi:glycosyltransferase involved in cell wall biosynthesis
VSKPPSLGEGGQTERNSRSPLVSIVCLAYNHEKFAREALRGMLSQTYAPLDIVILDDASLDATAQIIESELQRHPGRSDIRFVRNERNLGIRNNFAKGVSLARGRFIVNATTDDIMMPTMVEKMVKVWQDEGVSLVATNASYIDDNSNELNRFFRDPSGPYDETFETLARDGSNAVCFGPTQGFERSLYDEFGWPPEYLSEGDDILLAFYAHLAKGARFIPEPLLNYRVHAHNGSLSLEWERSRQIDKLVVEAEIYYVMIALSLFMANEIDRLCLADPSRFSEVAARIKPLLAVQTFEMTKKLVNTRIDLGKVGVPRLIATAA